MATRLDPTHYRMYAGSQGRWLRPDPAGRGATSLANPQSLNRYAYVGNNPTRLADPTGLLMSQCQVYGIGCGDEGGGGEAGEGDGSHPMPAPLQDTGPTPHVGTGPAAPLSQGRYNSCCQQAFGKSQGGIPGTSKTIPSYQASVDVVLASAATGESATVIGATLLAESNGNLLQPNEPHVPADGYVDVGPMQLNSKYLGKDTWHPSNAYGTDLKAGDPFNGNAYLNILAGASYLAHLGNQPWNYVGAGGTGASERESFLNMMEPKLKPFFDCLQKP